MEGRHVATEENCEVVEGKCEVIQKDCEVVGGNVR
jgi:hypothetical protein